MSRRVLIILATAAGLSLIAAIVWWFTQDNSNSSQSSVAQVDMPGTNDSQTVTPPAPPLSPQQIAESNLKNTALRFAELFGSYSSDSNYANLQAINSLVTGNFRQKVNALKSNPPAEGFYGVTTRALIANVASQTEATANVIVSTQRQELFSRQGEPVLRYQDLKLTMVREQGAWLIDGAVWQ
jgi:hypothetical protein